MCAEKVDAANPGQKEPVEGLELLERRELLAYGFNDTEIQHLSALQLLVRQHSNSSDLPAKDNRLEFARWLVNRGRLSEYIRSISDEQPLSEKALDTSPCAARVSQTRKEPLSGFHTGEQEIASTKWNGLGQRSIWIRRAWVRVRERLNSLVKALGGDWCTELLSGNESARRAFRAHDPYGSRWRHDPPRPLDYDIWYWMRYWHHG